MVLGICCCYFPAKDAAKRLYTICLFIIYTLSLNNNIYICTFKNTPKGGEENGALRIRAGARDESRTLLHRTGVAAFSNWCKDGEKLPLEKLQKINRNY